MGVVSNPAKSIMVELACPDKNIRINILEFKLIFNRRYITTQMKNWAKNIIKYLLCIVTWVFRGYKFTTNLLLTIKQIFWGKKGVNISLLIQATVEEINLYNYKWSWLRKERKLQRKLISEIRMIIAFSLIFNFLGKISMKGFRLQEI